MRFGKLRVEGDDKDHSWKRPEYITNKQTLQFTPDTFHAQRIKHQSRAEFLAMKGIQQITRGCLEKPDRSREMNFKKITELEFLTSKYRSLIGKSTGYEEL